MIGILRALLIRDLWTPIWPNLAASAITTIPALAWHHRRLARRIDAGPTTRGPEQ